LHRDFAQLILFYFCLFVNKQKLSGPISAKIRFRSQKRKTQICNPTHISATQICNPAAKIITSQHQQNPDPTHAAKPTTDIWSLSHP
jgi:hypothetical protein